MSATQNIWSPDLKMFYEQFSTGSPQWRISLNNRFAVWMMPWPAASYLLSTLGAQIFTATANAANGGSVANPYNVISMLVQSVELPALVSKGGDEDYEDAVTEFGYLSFPKWFLLTEENKFTISFLDTDYSIVDNFFSLWLAETTCQRWVYDEQPFTTATFFVIPLSTKNELGAAGSIGSKNQWVNLIANIIPPKHVYLLTRCFPCKLEMPKYNMTDSGELPVRGVEFKFSKMFILPNIAGLLESVGSVFN